MGPIECAKTSSKSAFMWLITLSWSLLSLKLPEPAQVKCRSNDAAGI